MDKHLELITRSRMQEAPPSPAIPRPNKHRIRFYLAAALVSLGLAALTWIAAYLIIAGYWYTSLAPIFLDILLIVNAPDILRKSYAKARIEELISEFDQISDRFTRPKIYRHKALNLSSPDIIDPKSFIYRLSVCSEGEIRLPQTTGKTDFSLNDFGSPISNHYGVHICIKDEVFHVTTRPFIIQNEPVHIDYSLFFINFFDKCSGTQEKIAHFRIEKYDVRSNVVTGEFSISGVEFDGFMKTLELSKNHRIASKR